MHTWEITQHIRNLESLVNALRDQPKAKSDYVDGQNSGMKVAANLLETEINLLRTSLERAEKNVI